jgi:hypothetical protein
MHNRLRSSARAAAALALAWVVAVIWGLRTVLALRS